MKTRYVVIERDRDHHHYHGTQRRSLPSPKHEDGCLVIIAKGIAYIVGIIVSIIVIMLVFHFFFP